MAMTYRIGDFSQETTSFRIHSAALTVGNIVAEYAVAATLRLAIADVISGTIQKVTMQDQAGALDNTWPGDAVAQRELKWLITYKDMTTEKDYRAELGTAELTDNSLLVAGTDIADLTDASWIAFVTQFEIAALSQDGNAVEIQQIRLVGRNL